MGLLQEWMGGLTASSSKPHPHDPFWYLPVGARSSTGLDVTPTTALEVATVLACVRVLSNTLGVVPLMVFERMRDGGKRQAPEHPLYDLLHDQPNAWQTAFEFRSMMMVMALLWGNFYAEIKPGQRGAVDELLPLHPDYVDVEQDENNRIAYRYRHPRQQERVLTQERVLHLRGISLDGVVGLNTVWLTREVLGLAMAQQQYGALLFKNGANPGLLLKHPGQLGDQARKNLLESFGEKYAGLGNAHRWLLLEEGMQAEKASFSAQEAQWSDARVFQAVEICRVFGVPPHKAGILDRATWNNIQSEQISYVQDGVLPWTVRIEQVVRRDLLIARERYFAEHVLEGLLRADALTRARYYSIMASIDAMTPNEIRARENLNPLNDGDRPLGRRQVSGEARRLDDDDNERERRREDRAAAMTADAAGRMVRREAEAVSRRAPQHANDPQGWQQWLATFYAEQHAPTVARALAVSMETASEYCEEQAAGVMREGVGYLTDRQDVHTARLVALAEREDGSHGGETPADSDGGAGDSLGAAGE